MRGRLRFLVPMIAASGMALGAAPVPAAAQCWVGTWASAQMVPEGENRLPETTPADATLRQTVRLTLGGERLRLVLSNAFGTAPLRIAAADVALSADPATPRIDAATRRAVTFGGARAITIPAGAEYRSDAIALAVPPLAHLSVTIRYDGMPAQQTGHPGARATSWLAAGDAFASADLPGATPTTRWYQLAGVEVLLRRGGAVAILGDSITDGYGVKADTDARWPDALAERLQRDRRLRGLAVLNLGIGGNRVLRDGLGPSAMARFARDVLARPGVTQLIVLEGVNDLGVLSREGGATPAARAALVAEMIAAWRQIVAAARERGIRVIGATILPFGGNDYYRPDAGIEASRQALNAWIRAPGNFDAVVDFDRLMRDPHAPERLAPALDSGDHLHPSIAGYRAMGDAVPLALLRAPRGC